MRAKELPAIDELLIILVLLHNIPIIGYHTPSLVFGVVVVLLYVFTIRDILAIWKIKITPILSATCPISLSCFANIIINQYPFATEIYGLLQNMAYPVIGVTLVRYDLPKTTKHLFWVLLLSYMVTALTTFIGCNAIPGVARLMASKEHLKESGMDSLIMNMNIGGFSYNYGWALMTTLLIMMIKEKNRYRWIEFAALVLFGLAIFASEYTTAIILYVVSLLLIFAPQVFKKRQFIVITILLSIIAVANLFWVSQLLAYLADNYFEGDVSSRLQDLSAVLSGQGHDVSDTSDMAERQQVYSKSIEALLSHPFGAWDIKQVGGHSFVLDCIGRFGILGIILIIVSYRSIFKSFIKPFSNSSKYGFALFAFLVTIITEIVNPQPNLIFITFILPVFWKFTQQTLLSHKNYESRTIIS